ncbi:hypothetical protein TRFO_32404 [Tritrichomonas foetus]|uniref:non-specific serine/threonine protein kinase n=1 Tax=Tritrichomonas foetus TaxID=1144522 RepID=A0A1J4JQ10_9EUKA|nr:hypothetical protein TRFO_32404 [Tritrichomonas foetus]|eukprot:OHT00842.1 hypothetical protein TRFO_32404 [Tritrichomonas foetus]
MKVNIDYVFSLLRPDALHDYKVWKGEYKRIIKILGPKLKIMNNEELFSLFEEWSKRVNPQENETLENFSIRMLFLTIHYYFTRSPILPAYLSIDPHYEDNSIYSNRVVMKTISLLCESAHDIEFIFSHPLKYLNEWFQNINSTTDNSTTTNKNIINNYETTSIEQSSEKNRNKNDKKKLEPTNEVSKQLNSYDQVKPMDDQSMWPNISFAMKYTRKFLPDKVVALGYQYWPTCFNIAVNSVGEVQDAMIKTLLSNTAYEGNDIYNTDILNDLKRRTEGFEIKFPTQIYALSIMFGCHLQIDNWNILNVIKRIANSWEQFYEIDNEGKIFEICTKKDLSKSIFGFTNFITRADFYDFDINSFFRFMLRHPTKTIKNYIEKYYKFLDTSIIQQYLLSDTNIFDGTDICIYEILESVFRYLPNFQIAPLKVLHFCKSYINCLKMHPELLTQEIIENAFELFNSKTENENILYLIIKCHSDHFPQITHEEFERYKLSSNFKIKKLFLETFEWISDPDLRNDKIISYMISEPNHKLRYKAMKYIIVTTRLSHNQLFSSFINDHSTKIRKKVFTMLAVMGDLNPLYQYPISLQYFESIISALTITSDLKYTNKMSKLTLAFATHCSHCQTCSSRYANRIIESVISVLNYEFSVSKDLIDNSQNEESDHQLEIDSASSSLSSSAIFFDEKFSYGSSKYSFRQDSDKPSSNSSTGILPQHTSHSSFCSNTQSNSTHYPNSFTKFSTKKISLKEQITKSFDEPLLLKRGILFINILTSMGHLCEPYLNKILNIYYSALCKVRVESFLHDIILSLKNLCVKINGGLNLSILYPRLQIPLLKRFNLTRNITLKKAILQLIGSSFDSIYKKVSMSRNDEEFYDISQSIYVDAILSKMLNQNFDCHWWDLKILGAIFEFDSEKSKRYALDSTKKIIQIMTNIQTKQPNLLFRCLTHILNKCSIEVLPIIHELANLISLWIDDFHCVKMMALLVNRMPSDYYSMIHDLYFKILKRFSFFGEKYFKWATRYITFSISSFKCPIDFYLDTLSTININDYLPEEVMKSFEYLCQNIDVVLYISNILQIALSINETVDKSNLFASLSKFQKFHYNFVNFNQTVEERIGNNHEVDVKLVKYSNNIQSFLPKYEKPDEFFNNIKIDKDFTVHLIDYSFKNSPIPFFRVFSEMIQNFTHLIHRLFPVVFLSIWETCTDVEKDRFTKMVNQTIEKGLADTKLLELVEFLDSHNCRLDIDYLKAAANPNIPLHYALVLFHRINILQNEFIRRTPNEYIPTLFFINQKLNLIDCSSAIFQKYKSSVTPLFAANYNHYLGNWSEALELYDQCENPPLSKKLGCLFRLRRYDEILDYYDELLKVEDSKEKRASLSLFLWVFSMRRENYKIEKILTSMKFLKKGNVLYPLIIYCIQTNQFDIAENFVNVAFKTLYNFDFKCSDKIKMNRKLTKLQLLCEISEVIDIKKGRESSTYNDISELWMSRVKHFERKELMWERMIMIRSLVRPINSNHSFYLPTIIELRKSGHFDIIHHYFDVILKRNNNVGFIIENFKILWAEGKLKAAFYGISTACNCAIVSNIAEYVYLCTIKKIYLPSIALYQNTEFSNKSLKDYIKDYFNASSFENAMKYFDDKSLPEQQEIFSHLVLKFPALFFKIFQQHSFFESYFPKICELAGKFSSFYDTKTSYHFYNASILLDGNRVSQWKGWALANLALFFDSKDKFAKEIEYVSPFSISMSSEKEGNENLYNSASSNEAQCNSQEAMKNIDDSMMKSNIYFVPSSYDQNANKGSKFIQKTLSDPLCQNLNDYKTHSDTSKASSVITNGSICDDSSESFVFQQCFPMTSSLQSNKSEDKASLYKGNVKENIDIMMDASKIMLSGEASRIGKEIITTHCSKIESLPLNEKYQKIINHRREILSKCVPEDNPKLYAINLIKACLKIVDMDENSSYEFLVQLFFAIFAFPDQNTLPTDIIESVSNICPSLLVEMIPQISSHFLENPFNSKSINNKNVNKELNDDNFLSGGLLSGLIETLLLSASLEDFQAVYFSVNLYSKGGNVFAKDLLNKIINIEADKALSIYEKNKVVNYQNLNLYNDLIDGESFEQKRLKHAEECELFDSGMVKASQTIFERWKIALEIASQDPNQDEILQKLFTEVKNPSNELDELFARSFDSYIAKTEHLFNIHTIDSLNAMWSHFNQLHIKLQSVLNRLTNVLLQKSSAEISNYYFSQMRIPGSNNEYMYTIEDSLEVLGTQQRPRSVNIVTKSGQKLKFLLKANEDLRVDGRIIQFFTLMNVFLRKAFKRTNLEITCYSIIPLRKDCGLIRFVSNSVSFLQLVTEAREREKVCPTIESFLDKEFSNQMFIKMNSLQKYEFFEYVFENRNASELFDSFFIHSKNSVDCFNKVQTFTKSTALMSIIGHIIGLGDRHPSNILIDISCGKSIHIDFGDIFEVAQKRRDFPEKVPFRLTRMFKNSIEGAKTSGLFEKTCVSVIKLIRKKRSSLAAQLTVFLKESQNRKGPIIRVMQKLSGQEFGKQLTPEEEASKLIEIASDPKNYCRHYPGWCPFW